MYSCSLDFFLWLTQSLKKTLARITQIHLIVSIDYNIMYFFQYLHGNAILDFLALKQFTILAFKIFWGIFEHVLWEENVILAFKRF